MKWQINSKLARKSNRSATNVERVAKTSQPVDVYGSLTRLTRSGGQLYKNAPPKPWKPTRLDSQLLACRLFPCGDCAALTSLATTVWPAAHLPHCTNRRWGAGRSVLIGWNSLLLLTSPASLRPCAFTFAFTCVNVIRRENQIQPVNHWASMRTVNKDDSCLFLTTLWNKLFLQAQTYVILFNN